MRVDAAGMVPSCSAAERCWIAWVVASGCAGTALCAGVCNTNKGEGAMLRSLLRMFPRAARRCECTSPANLLETPEPAGLARCVCPRACDTRPSALHLLDPGTIGGDLGVAALGAKV